MEPLEFWILDEQFESIYIIDSAESLIWTERFCGYGDFQIYAMVDPTLFASTPQNYYVWKKGSDRLMIVDTRNLNTDVAKGSHLKIEGVSLEHILTRRIVWFQTRLNGKIEGQIQKLLNENIINPVDPKRKIANFRFLASGSSYIDGITIDETYTGDNVYDVVNQLCEEHGIGWRVMYNPSGNLFEFQLYETTDRSYDQIVNPYVVFSPGFDNILSSNYYETNRDARNVALVAGEDTGVGTNRKTVTVDTANKTGLHRREMYVDARDIQSERQDQSVMTPEEYNEALRTRGIKYLNEAKEQNLFEGEVEASQTFVYGVDFVLGDTVQILDAHGIEAKARIDEIIFAEGQDGRSVVPTFSMV